MTTQQINEEIKQLEALIYQKNASAEAYKKQGQDWLDDAYKTRNCTGTKKRKDACNAENQRKTNVGNGYMSQANTLLAEVKQHEARIVELRKMAQASALTDSEVAKVLAGQGMTFASVQVLAEKQGEAEVEKQRTVAQAEAQAVSDKANTNKTIGYVVIAVIVVGAIVGIGFLIKKLRKK